MAPSATAGTRKAASSRIAGKATTRACCCTYWRSARLPIRCRPRPMRPGRPPTSGSAATTSTTCTAARCSPISCRRCGSTFAASATRSCAARASTTSRTADAPRLVQQRYASDNPLGFKGYSDHCWGITASDGPGPATLKIDGIERRFEDYVGRGAPYGIDDGTLAPWAVVASLPFAPEIVLPTVHHFIHTLQLHDAHPYGFRASFNQTWVDKPGQPRGRLGVAVLLRPQPRPDRADGGKPAQRHAVGADARLPLDRRRFAPRRLRRRLARRGTPATR